MYRIGIDLGGTNIAVGVVRDMKELVSTCSVPTGAHRPYDQVVADMAAAVEAAAAKAGIAVSDCESIGIGAPGTCDSERGVVVRAYNLNWFDVPVCRMLSERFSIPCRLSNDANCAALAEVVAGRAQGVRDMVLITLGTGVGGGIIIGGRIYAGMRSAGAELGHVVLVLDGEPCTCGRRGCWESYASVTALLRQAERAAAAHPESLMNGQKITGEVIFDAADRGDTVARDVIDQWVRYVAAGLTDCVNALAPQMILIGGGISRQGERILRPMREYVVQNCFGGEKGAVPVIEAAALGGEAGIIGAAAL